MLTFEIKAKKVTVRKREVLNSLLMIPIEDRIPLLERLTTLSSITKLDAVKDQKYCLATAIIKLTNSELSEDDIRIILLKIGKFNKELHQKMRKLQKEYEEIRV